MISNTLRGQCRLRMKRPSKHPPHSCGIKRNLHTKTNSFRYTSTATFCFSSYLDRRYDVVQLLSLRCMLSHDVLSLLSKLLHRINKSDEHANHQKTTEFGESSNSGARSLDDDTITFFLYDDTITQWIIPPLERENGSCPFVRGSSFFTCRRSFYET